MSKHQPTLMQRAARWVFTRAAKYAGIPLRDPALKAMLGSAPSMAGIDVDEDSALNFSAVWSAVTLLSGTIASLPAGAYQSTKEGHKRLEGDPVDTLLARAPNPEMTPYVYHETLLTHALLWGNYYSQIEWVGNVPVALWPLMPNQVDLRREPDGTLRYHFTGLYPGEESRVLHPSEVLHVPGLGFDGIKGYSVVSRARESIGLGLAAEMFGASFFGRGTVPTGIIKHPGDLGETGKKNIRESFEMLHRGPHNSHRLAVLDEGMEFQSISMPLEDAQFLQTRQFQTVEVARWFNVPPHMLRDLSQATYSNIEHQGLDFLMYSLRPWLVRIQQEYNRKLFADRGDCFMDHDPSELLRTDMSTRFQAYNTARNGGWYTLNHILRKENMNPLPPEIGDTHLAPSTMKVLEDEARKTAALQAAGGDDIQGTAMNGAQVTSLMTILTTVSSGQLDPASAKAAIQIAFPAADEVSIGKMLAPYLNVKPTPAEPLLKPSGKRKSTPVEQQEAYTCGPAALLAILRPRGVALDEPQLAAMCGTTEADGTSAAAMFRVLSSFVKCREVTGASLTDLSGTCVCCIQAFDCNPQSKTDGHWVVVDGVDAAQVTGSDPATGERFAVSREEFLMRWHDSGLVRYAIILEE